MRGVIMPLFRAMRPVCVSPLRGIWALRANPRSIGRMSVIQATVILSKPQGIIRANTVSDCTIIVAL